MYVAAGVAPLIWYAGETAGTGVAHGPNVFAGIDLPLGPVRADAYVGAGVAPAVGEIRPALCGGIGLGMSFL